MGFILYCPRLGWRSISEEHGEYVEVVNEMVLESTGIGDTFTNHPRWHRQVAMTTLVMALITAIGSLFAGTTASEALLDRTRELVDVAIVENDQGNIETLRTKIAILKSLGEVPDPSDLARIGANETKIAAASAESDAEEANVQRFSSIHLILAVAVTLVSIAIALSGMSIIVDQ